MDTINRRDYFRHTFPRATRPRVELRRFGTPDGAADLVAEAVDLSLGGLCLVFPREQTAALGDQLWVANFTLAEGTVLEAHLELNCSVVHWYHTGEGYVYGFRFSGIEAPSQAETRRILWRYLLTVPRAEIAHDMPADAFDDDMSIDLCDKTPLPPAVPG